MSHEIGAPTFRRAALLLLMLSACQCTTARSTHGSSKGGSQTPHTVYDQKQTGDYNVQLHLKDFQVIALLPGESGAFGDYDYAYDYSDFTVKPVTQKPLGESSSSSLSPSSTTVVVKPAGSSTLKPSNHPYPIVSPSTTTIVSRPSSTTPISETTSTKPIETLSVTRKQLSEEDELVNIIQKHNITISEALLGKPEQSTTQKIESGSTNKSVKFLETSTETIPKLEETMAPGKIKVQIIQTPSIGIVADEDSHEQNEAVPQLEGGAVLRRCASGFTRDKRGRCRRVRKPGTQLPFGFNRFASNLASRFRQPSIDSPVSTASEE